MNNDTIANEALPVNEDCDFDTISLDGSDPSFQYKIVPNKLIRDVTISPNCRWLIIYLISNKPGWTIKSRQLWEHTKGFIGRDGIRKILNEAIEAGYIKRDTFIKGNLRGFSYKVASSPKFKKCFRCPEIQVTESREPEFQGPENQGIKEVLSKELLSLRENTSLKVSAEDEFAKANEMDLASLPKAKREKVEFSPKVREVGTQIINILTKHESEYIPPKNLAPMLQELDFMLRLDKRDADKIYDVLNWALADSFWRDKMFKSNPVKYLREKYLQLKNKMEEKPKANPNQVDRRLREKDGSVVDAWKDELF